MLAVLSPDDVQTQMDSLCLSPLRRHRHISLCHTSSCHDDRESSYSEPSIVCSAQTTDWTPRAHTPTFILHHCASIFSVLLLIGLLDTRRFINVRLRWHTNIWGVNLFQDLCHCHQSRGVSHQISDMFGVLCVYLILKWGIFKHYLKKIPVWFRDGYR